MREICMPGGFVALVDDEDYEWLIRDYAWHKIKGESTFYAHAWLRGSKPKRKVYMHRIILGVPKGIEVDHIDGNGLNIEGTICGPVQAAKTILIQERGGFMVEYQQRAYIRGLHRTRNRVTG
jgi:hypothetical protein